MRYLGIDFGTKRIGLALGYRENNLIFPLKTVVKKTNAQVMSELLSLIREYHIDGIVVGIPRDLHGQETLTTRQVKNFVTRLQKTTAIPVETSDETLSSFEAEERLLDAQVPGSKKKAVLDQMAAVIILENFLIHDTTRSCSPTQKYEQT
jgi:putative Holliday junction resolvase